MRTIMLLVLTLLAMGIVMADHNLADVETDTPESIEEGWKDVINDPGYNEPVQNDTTNPLVEVLTAPNTKTGVVAGAQAIDYDGDGIGTIVIFMTEDGIRPATAAEISQLNLN